MPDELFTPVTQPSSASDANRIVVLEEGVETHTTKSYGIGIDCHSKFIQVTLTDSNDRNFYVEDYAPSSYRNIGDQTVVPVYIKPYRKSNGQLSYTICIKKDFETRGESF